MVGKGVFLTRKETRAWLGRIEVGGGENSKWIELSPPPTSILPNLALVSFLVKNTHFPTIVFFNPDRYME